MLIKFDSTFKEALKIAGETDFEAQGVRLVGISAIGGFAYMQIEPLASGGVLSDIEASIGRVKAEAVMSIPPSGYHKMYEIYANKVDSEYHLNMVIETEPE